MSKPFFVSACEGIDSSGAVGRFDPSAVWPAHRSCRPDAGSSLAQPITHFLLVARLGTRCNVYENHGRIMDRIHEIRRCQSKAMLGVKWFFFICFSCTFSCKLEHVRTIRLYPLLPHNFSSALPS